VPPPHSVGLETSEASRRENLSREKAALTVAKTDINRAIAKKGGGTGRETKEAQKKRGYSSEAIMVQVLGDWGRKRKAPEQSLVKKRD